MRISGPNEKAKVIALYEKRKRYEANNYRPISLLSIFDKLLEKLLCRRVMKFLNADNILFKFQYGFRKLHSTTPLALIEFTDSVRRFLDDGNYVISIFVDLTKALTMKYFYINLTDMAFAVMPMISFEHILQIDFFCPVYKLYLWICRDGSCAALCWRYCSLYVA